MFLMSRGAAKRTFSLTQSLILTRSRARVRLVSHPRTENITSLFFQARGLGVQRKGQKNNKKNTLGRDGYNGMHGSANGGIVKNDDIVQYMRAKGGREVRVVGGQIMDDSGEDVKSQIMDVQDALQLGRQVKLDLVLVAPSAQPPTCKLMDVGLENYKRKKNEAEQRKTAPKSQTKGIRMKVNIADGDFERKVKDGIKFVSKGMDVRISVIVQRPRYGQDPEIVQKQNDAMSTTLLKRYVDRLSEVAEIVAAKSGGVVQSEGQSRFVDLRPKS